MIGIGLSLLLIYGRIPSSIRAYVDRTLDEQIPPVLFLVFLLCNYVGVVIHEVGHFVAGRVAGLQPNLLRVGPLQVNAPFRLSWHWREKTGMRGFTSMLPKDGDLRPETLLIMVAGGPAANLLSAMLMLLLQRFVAVPPALGGTFVFSSLLLGFGNLLPFQHKSASSDGSRIRMLLSKRERGERWLSLFQLLAALGRGSDFEDLSPELLARATAFKDNSPDTVAAHAIAYTAAFYKGSTAEAAQLLEICLQYSPYSSSIMREALIADAAVFQARKNRRVGLAEQWLADLPQKPQFPGLRFRAEAAIMEAQGDIDGALEKLHENEKAVLAIPNRLQRELSLRGLRRWKSELGALARAKAF